MFTQVLRKSLTLLLIYAVLIVGIFILQFKNDSIISEKFGNLHVSLLSSVADDNSVSLKNRFNIIFNGITFAGNDDKCAKATINSREKDVSIISWKKISPLSCVLNFSNNINLKFSVSDENPHAYLLIEAEMPDNVTAFSLPYGLVSGATITSQSDDRLQIFSKRTDWEFSAGDIDSNRVVFTRKKNTASYAYYDKSRSFSFDQIAGLEASSESSYLAVIENFKTNLINSFAQIPSDAATIGEQEAVSYVAAMAEKGRYNEALDAVPAGFKKSTARTFLSAPYFDTLAKVNEPLQLQLQSYADLVQRAASADSLDIYSTQFISDYMLMNESSESVKAMLSRTATQELEGMTVQQASAVLCVYDNLAEKASPLASLLYPAAVKCVARIQASCNLDDNLITLAEKGTFLSVIQAVEAGDSLLRFGRLTGNNDYIAGGRFIVGSYLKESSSFDVHTLGELYPIAVHGNSYYPHFEVLGFENNECVWAWTCGGNISYKKDEAGTITLSIDFPMSYTHYLIVNGIDPFRAIYIYDIAFRSDYRFETYNSSGYIYQPATKSLLLKSRHKADTENIRLIYTVAAQEKAETPEEEEAAAE
ncbi:MAG: hypothetical protein UHO11_03930 [Treponema sp.]|nr:hypothetical protein [Treponema sp.]